MTAAAAASMVHPRRDAVIATLVALTAFASNPACGQTADASSGAVAPSTTTPSGPAARPVVHRMRVGLTVAGALVFAAAWIPAVVIAATGADKCDGESCRDAHAYLPVPVLGPVLAATQVSNIGAYVWPWSLAQAAGVAMFVVGLIGHDLPADPNKSTVTVLPTASPHAAGLVLRARF